MSNTRRVKEVLPRVIPPEQSLAFARRIWHTRHRIRVHLRRIAVLHWWLDRCLAGCSGTDRESRPYSFGGRFSIRAVTSQQMSDGDVCTASQTCCPASTRHVPRKLSCRPEYQSVWCCARSCRRQGTKSGLSWDQVAIVRNYRTTHAVEESMRRPRYRRRCRRVSESVTCRATA